MLDSATPPATKVRSADSILNHATTPRFAVVAVHGRSRICARSGGGLPEHVAYVVPDQERIALVH
jgi:hypothetical protein